MIFKSVLSIILPLALGFTFLCAFWPGTKPVRSNLSLKLSLSVGTGLGLFSCLYFMQLSLFGPSRKRLVAEVMALLITMLAVLSYRILRLKGLPATEPQQEAAPKGGLHKAILIAFLIALASSAITFIFYSLKRPHGDWDAWAVYNMKARFLFRAGENWKDVFSGPLEWAVPDYPLLEPAMTAGCWTLLGAETLVIPALLAMLFTFASVGVTASSISILRGQDQGLLAGLVLLCTPFFIVHGANQYSDVPIGLFYLCTLALFALQDGLVKTDYRFLFLAGIMSGLAAWTKNEGLLFILLVFVSRFAVTFPRGGIKPYIRQMLSFAAGLAPVLLVVFYFKASISASSYLFAPTGGQSLGSKLSDFSRYRFIADYFFRVGIGFGSWVVGIVPLLAFYLLLLGADIEERRKASIIASLMLIGLMLAGFFMIYVLSPRDLGWHLATTYDRLLSQLWPSLVFTFFLTVKTPEQAIVKKDAMPVSA